MVVMPGEFSFAKAQDGTTLADEAFLTVLDPINYAKAPASDDQGRIVFRASSPAHQYRLSGGETIPAVGPELHKVFTVRPGETLDLGDILIRRSGT